MRVAAITGFSGSGKTTLICALIGRYVAAGARVGAIKHTHHPLNEERRGDTGRFEAAGASPVILAGQGAAVVFLTGRTERVTYERPSDLLEQFEGVADVVLVEGFKELGEWQKVEIASDRRLSVDEAAAILDRIWASP